jgi:hypothetical protein
LLRCVGREPATSICGRRSLSALRRALVAGMAVGVLSSLVMPADAASRRFKDTAAKSQRFTFGELPPGPLQLVVSIRRQQVTLYSNGQRVAQVPVSTGTPGHPTPKGIFSVIEKDRWHRSNLYYNAPMYFMHRLTWSGVAMHEGVLPGVPASHGCIRLPREFAVRLWAVSKLGVRVVVSADDVVPEDFAHPKLFVRKEKPADIPAAPEVLFDTLRPSLSEFNVAPGEPIKLVSAATNDQFNPELSGIQPVLNTHQPPNSAPVKKAEPPKHSGQVAVFVSRKEKKIFVRQNFVPLFDMPIEIANPEQPLGTHLFTALELQPDGSHMRWNAVTIPSGDDAVPDRGRRAGRKAALARQPVAAMPGPSAAEALGRIRFPQEAIERIEEVLVPGSSLIISDLGLGNETGRFTEFIVVTR